MAKIQENYNVGNRDDITTDQLVRILEDMYKTLAVAINKKPDFFQRTTDGLVTDSQLSNGSINLNTNTKKLQILVDHPTSSTVTWKEI
jgi:hypothetical protein